MSTQSYPEFDHIPPAPAQSPSLVPQWAAAILSTFPLITFPAAKSYSPSTSALPKKPTLYVAPHLNRDGTLSAVHDHDDNDSSSHDENAFNQQPLGWSSIDPIALRWQMELLFRQVDFDVRFIDPSHNWGPAKSMPFLHLPTRFRSANAASSSLLSAIEIPYLLDNYYPYITSESGEKPSSSYPDDMTTLEARSWENLVKGRIMAGVLLAVLLSPQSAVYSKIQSQPYLSSLLSAQLLNSFFDQQLRRISALNPSASKSSTSTLDVSLAQPTTSLPGWEVGFLGWIGATTASATSALSSAELDSRGGGDTPGAALASPSVDQHKVVTDAVAGLGALAARTQSQLSKSSEQVRYLLGAQKPTSLDALAFSVIHTILTLAATPQAQNMSDNQPLNQLKQVLDQSPWLVKWSRQMWKVYVRDLDRAS
ncbi:uncharacterized protein MEPE_01540 [Melanopsichium pennsylvanicum]|uniref:Metaxin glutathione S-transferase domain-containing protein n=2 Tax=Melanopsichium pennsylvanicum TaxID=63383 RepID=A0AAJ4XI66_9BASI|nr:putative protein [Melanopsichium pennsylvanicum 4]SNX82834.1 uncharacterized protein MEPE_01540 [Melanopsichium pennsylvanicum]